MSFLQQSAKAVGSKSRCPHPPPPPPLRLRSRWLHVGGGGVLAPVLSRSRCRLCLLQAAHASSATFSNSEERVQQLLQLQLAQRQEVAALSSALQTANIRVQTLETQLRTAQAAPPPLLLQFIT